MQILSIFLKLQAVKQSGPDVFGLPGICDMQELRCLLSGMRKSSP